MRLSYVIFLAFKNLSAHKMRSILTASGVAISVGFIVFLMSFGFGLQRISVNQVANVEALKILDVSIAKSEILKINDDVIKKFERFSKVENVKPQIVSASKITYGKSEIDGVVYGKNPDHVAVENIKLLSGRVYKKDSKEAIINVAALEQFGIKNMLNKEVTLDVIIRSDLLNNTEESSKFSTKVKIVGVLDDKSAPFIYLPLKTFKDNGIKNYSSVKVLVGSTSDVAQTKLQIESLGYKVISIKETIDQIKQFFALFQIILLFLGSIAVIIACLGMFNTMTITLIEKTREVGFMKALGNTRKDIYNLFTLEATIIGLFGSLIGVIGGLSIGAIFNAIIYNLAQSTGNQAEQLFYMPLYMPIFVLAVTIVISVLTGLYPANRASRISSLDALRYE